MHLLLLLFQLKLLLVLLLRGDLETVPKALLDPKRVHTPTYMFMPKRHEWTTTKDIMLVAGTLNRPRQTDVQNAIGIQKWQLSSSRQVRFV